MDMAPRWEEGYGFQVRYENFGSDDLMDGDSEISNPLGLKTICRDSLAGRCLHI